MARKPLVKAPPQDCHLKRIVYTAHSLSWLWFPYRIFELFGRWKTQSSTSSARLPSFSDRHLILQKYQSTHRSSAPSPAW